MFRKNWLTIISVILSAIFTVYIVLDTFVITKTYALVQPNISITTEKEAETQTPAEAQTQTETQTETQVTVSEVVQTENTYEDEHIKINLTTYREYNTDIYVADIVVDSSDYLKTALAGNAYGKNVTDITSNMAADNNAILAINGDYYGVQEEGYVIRNGQLFRESSKDNQEDLAIYIDGSMEIISEEEITAESLIERGVYNLLSFGPGLLKDGQITVSTTDEVDKAMASNPRTAIGIIDDLHYVFVVADGRTNSSEGLSLYELAEFMQGLDVSLAYNLDGGGSSTMYFNGAVVNNPTSGGKGGKHHSSSGTSERSVSDIVYIGY